MADPVVSTSTKLRSNLNDRLHNAKSHLWKIHQYNVQTFRQQPLAEISGSVGDMGTLLPIMIALTAQGSISLSSTLVFGGLANIVTGMVFGIPLPVQPMKAIAAVAISRRLSTAETASAGLFVASAIGLLSFTGLIQWFTNRIPIPVVKGIQVGTGLSLIVSAGSLYQVKPWNNVVLLFAFLGLLTSATLTRVPYALIILLMGILTVLSKSVDTVSWHWLGFDIWNPRTFLPSPRNFLTGSLNAGMGQLPLTTLNSVIAVSFLAADLFPDLEAPSTTSLGLSVMAINLVACWFRSMPVCHGSGGLAAQYRFGARSGASIIFLGIVKLVLGLFASKSAKYIFNGFPSTLLCILMIAAGLELAKVGGSFNTAGTRDLDTLHRTRPDTQITQNRNSDRKASEFTEEEKKRRRTVMIVTVAGIVAFRNDAVGFVAGMLCHWSFGLEDKWNERRAQRSGSIRLDDGAQP